MPDETLSKLRTEIDSLDEQLLSILAKRKHIVSQVGVYKSQHGVPIVAPDREISLLDKRRRQAKSLGLNPDLVESILKRIMISSYKNESNIKFQQLNKDIKSIVIIGGKGKLGSLFNSFLSKSGYAVKCIDKHDWPRANSLCQEADCIFLSVPIHVTLEVIKLLPPLKPSCLLTDLTSIKSSPLNAMLAKHPGPVLGLHPMFGPDITHFAKQVIINCPGRHADKSQWLLEQFALWGATNKSIGAQQHDRQMSIIQALRHFSTLCFGLNLCREKSELKELLELSSPIYRIEIIMVARLFCQDSNLYFDIISSNPDNLALIKRFASITHEVIQYFESGDKEQIKNLFEQTREYFGQYATSLMNESVELIETMVHSQGKS